MTPEIPVQPGPGLDLGAVSGDPHLALPLQVEEHLHLVSDSGPGWSEPRRFEGSEVDIGQPASHVSRRVIGDPPAEGGMFPESGIEVL